MGSKRNVYVTLGTHCDLFWMGTHPECLEMGVAIQRHALDLMEQYEDYCYYIETTIFAEYHLEKHPGDRVRMQRLMDRGQLEIGASFVDRIEHLHHGESLIRHVVEGVRWLDETFGSATRTAMHPDLPGLSPQVPQIYAQAGVECYLRARGFGNVYDWIAPDGSRILYCNLHGYGKKTLERYLQILAEPSTSATVVLRGGYGDLRDCEGVEVLERLAEVRARHPEVNVRLASPRDVVPLLAKDSHPRLSGEMPFGWGSPSTAFAEIMAQSVELEHRLLTAEKLEAWCLALGLPASQASVRSRTARDLSTAAMGRLHGDVLDAPLPEGQYLPQAYEGDVFGHPIRPGDHLRQMWRFELLCQDHNYGGRHGAQSNWDRKAMREHALGCVDEIIDASLDDLGDAAPSEGLLVFNPVSWPQEDLLVVPDALPETLAVLDASGQALPSQPSEEGLVVAPPLLGALAVERFSLTPRIPPVVRASPSGDLLAGEGLEARIDTSRGMVSRLREVATGLDMLQADRACGLGTLLSYDDPGIDVRYGLTGDVTSDVHAGYEVVAAEDGPLYARTTLAGTFLECHVEKQYTLHKRAARLDLCVRIAWWGKRNQHLRVCFPFAQEGYRDTWYGVPFCAMRWPEMLDGDGITDAQTLRQGEAMDDMLTAKDRRHFREVIGWLDVGYSDHGLTLGTRSTSWWIDGPRLEAVLLRTQRSCGDQRLWNLNQGLHQWRFRVQLHPGDWREGKAYRVGEETLNPVVATHRAGAGAGGVERSSMAESWQVSPDNVMVTAFKRSDADPGAVLVRLLECEGTRCDVTLRVPFPFESAVAVDLLERPLDSLDSDGSSLRIALRPHQFQTVRLSLGHSAND